MSKLSFRGPHRKVRAVGLVRPERLARLKPVTDSFRARASDLDEQAPPCPRCRSAAATPWHIDRRTTAPVLVCLNCVPTNGRPVVTGQPSRAAA